MIETSVTATTASLGAMRCRTVASGGFKNLNYVRNLPPIPVEERLGPLERDNVATPFETLLAALGSCLASRIHANATLGNIRVQELELELEADIVTTTQWRADVEMSGPPGLDAIRVRVHMRADAPATDLRTLIAHSLMLSPVANTLHGPVDLEVILAEKTGPAV